MEYRRDTGTQSANAQWLAVSIFHRKWQVAILSLLKDGPTRLSQLERSLPGISRKVLLQNLKKLTGESLVERVDLSTKTKHVEYRLNRTMPELQAAIELACQWQNEERNRSKA